VDAEDGVLTFSAG